MAQRIKNLPAIREAQVQSLDWEDLLEKGMAIHSSILARRIPWTEEPGGLQPMGLQSLTRLRDYTFTFHFHKMQTIGIFLKNTVTLHVHDKYTFKKKKKKKKRKMKGTYLFSVQQETFCN